mmetsp:Transcript_30376/g.71100  ORF Transcript_30376/g.71100 Transcript_30376/m.71100 type:complete len:247 (+) Transcript_30376:79-819(+)
MLYIHSVPNLSHGTTLDRRLTRPHRGHKDVSVPRSEALIGGLHSWQACLEDLLLFHLSTAKWLWSWQTSKGDHFAKRCISRWFYKLDILAPILIGFCRTQYHAVTFEADQIFRFEVAHHQQPLVQHFLLGVVRSEAGGNLPRFRLPTFNLLAIQLVSIRVDPHLGNLPHFEFQLADIRLIVVGCVALLLFGRLGLLFTAAAALLLVLLLFLLLLVATSGGGGKRFREGLPGAQVELGLQIGNAVVQ